MSLAADAPDPLVAISRASAPPPAGLVLRRGDWGAFRAAEPGTDAVLLLRPTSEGLRIERAGLFETVAWDDVVGVALTHVRLGAVAVPVARIQFRRGPSLDLADVLAPGSGDLPMAIEAGGPPLLRTERLRLVVAAVVAAAGLAPRSRDQFHRGGRGFPAPELVARPRRLPRWAPPLLLAASVAVLVLLFPALGWGGAIAVHVALLLHEAGHALAMHLTGTQVRSILFLPALGAATLTEHPYRSRWADVLVALAGPCTGIPIAALALALFDEPPPAAVRWGLVVAVAYNLLNLLPFVPLDGGRVLVAVLAGLPRVLRTVLTWVPLAVAVLLVLVIGPSAAGLGVLLLLGVGIVMTRLVVRRLDFHQWVLDVRIAPDALRAALRDVTWGFGNAARDDVDGGVPATPMAAGQAVIAMLLFAVVVAALAACTLALEGIVPEIHSALVGGDE
jgi:Zn-dependent protease